MKTKAFLTLCVLFLSQLQGLFAQTPCDTGRYYNLVFTSFNLTSNILYGNNINYQGNSENLLLDVYEPAGDDTTVLRPLIIMAHGGNFLSGTKTQGDVKPLCEDLAKMGYVTSSINYRVGMEDYPTPNLDSADASESVFRATHDARAAVRFFRKDVAENGNTWKIDTSLIFFGGSSAGGFMALHLAYLDDINDKPSYIDTSKAGLGGGVEGNSGNPGYSSKAAAVINLSGALGDTAWMNPGDTPVLSLHGDQDNVVPFGSALIYLLGFWPLLEVDGSQSVQEQAAKLGITSCFKPYWGADHTPHWGGHPGEAQYYDTTLTYIKHFLLQFVCGYNPICGYVFDTTDTSGSTGIKYLEEQNAFFVYPNPAGQQLYVDLGNLKSGQCNIELYDYTGKLVRKYQNIQNNTVSIGREGLKSGLYFINIHSGKGIYRGKVVLE